METTVRKDIFEISAQNLQRFGLLDYGAFVALLFVSILVGIYFGFFKVAENAQDYLVGGRNMKAFPVALSLIASFISGISLLGTPTEIYVYGVTFVFLLLAMCAMAFVLLYAYVPVFHQLRCTSIYEYLERRFDRRIRLFGAFLFSIAMITWLPIVIYVPALAFNQVTGINVHIITPVICIVCIFYTCVGGLKAVVWTDVIQSFFMFGSLILVMVKGTMDIGGPGVVWSRNYESGRIELPDFSWSPTTRHTIWSLFFGGFFYWLQVAAINQIMLQRYLALPDLKTVRKAVWGFILGYSVLLGCTSYCGMLIYATYHSCDPLSTKLAKAKDQLLPLLVMDILGDIPGLPGLFIAGVFSAALSSLSTGLNSMAAVVLEDFYKPFFPKITEFQTEVLCKTVVVALGFLFVGLAFLVEKMGTVLQLSISLGSVTNGPNLAIFSIGLLAPWIKSESTFVGGVAGLSFMGWLCLNSQAAILAGNLKFPEKPVSTDGCHYSFHVEQPPVYSLISDSFNMTSSEAHELFDFYKISYLWYVLVGTFVTFLFAILASFYFGWNDPRDIDPKLLSPLIRSWIKPRKFDRNAENPDDIINAYTPCEYTRNQIEMELQ